MRFTFGRMFHGFHVCFNIARGGLRVVRPRAVAFYSARRTVYTAKRGSGERPAIEEQGHSRGRSERRDSGGPRRRRRTGGEGPGRYAAGPNLRTWPRKPTPSRPRRKHHRRPDHVAGAPGGQTRSPQSWSLREFQARAGINHKNMEDLEGGGLLEAVEGPRMRSENHPFTVKMTGGPDGDGQMPSASCASVLGAHARIVAIADGDRFSRRPQQV